VLCLTFAMYHRESTPTPRSVPPTAMTTWMLRICNDTSLHIDQLYIMDDLGVADLSPGACSNYWEMDHVVNSDSLTFVSGGESHGRDPLPGRKNLPPGFWSYHVTLADPAHGQSSLQAIEDHPTMLMRICNDTGKVVRELSWNDASMEGTLHPGECGPYRPVYVAAVHSPDAFFEGEDSGAVKFTVAPIDAAVLRLAAERWTFHLEIRDTGAHTAAIRRNATAD